ncbi:MAG: hypothetical protein JRH20_30330 [Deltaproteobacteria bacterium]|nr:hypothetical protein [Deltaproteobacteria bacterium]
MKTAIAGELPDDWVTALVGGPAGRLWVGTYDGGLAAIAKSARGSERFVEARGLPCGWINAQGATRVGDLLLFGTLAGGLVVRHGGGWRRFSLRHGLPSRDVTAIVETHRSGEVWIGTRRGLLRARLMRTGGGT